MKTKTYKLRVAAPYTFEGLVQLGNYDWVAPEVREKFFPLRARREQDLKLKLVDCSFLGREVETQVVLSHVASKDLWPANTLQLLAFGCHFKDVQRHAFVVALNAKGILKPAERNSLSVLILAGFTLGRSLTVRQYDGKLPRHVWLTDRYKFLCVSK